MRKGNARPRNELIVSVSIETGSGTSGLEFAIPSETSLGRLGGVVSERVREWSVLTENNPRRWTVIGLHSSRDNLLSSEAR